jgi:hypothetical protein
MVDAQTLSIVFAGVSIGVAAIYYTMTLRNSQRAQQLQLETRQAQMFMQIYNQLNDTGFQKAFQKIAPMKIQSYTEFIKEFSWDTPEGMENFAALDRIVSYYEGVGVLVKEGLLDIKYVALLMTGMTILLWEKMGSFAEDVRNYYGNKRWASEWEYLYHELLKYLEQHPELKP